MKKTLVTLLITATAPFAFAQSTTTTSSSTTTTTTANGTVAEYQPGASLVITENGSPVTYKYGETVTYVTKSGKTLTADEAKTRIAVGAPVSVSYTTEGDSRLVNRVEIEETTTEVTTE